MILLLFTAAAVAVLVGMAAHGWAGQSRRDPLSEVRGISRCHPLQPWPQREWEAYTCNPDEAYQARQALWEWFAAREHPQRVLLPWYSGTRLRVQMGNELSRSLFVIGAFDANEFAFLDGYLRPGMVFLDAGAHEGLYSVFAAARTGRDGRVLAVEPSEREREACQANLDLNRLEATVIPCAVGDSDGEAELVLAQDHRSGHNTLGAFAWEGVQTAERRRVALRSLDSLAEEYGLTRLDVVKMDIEGAETKALRGGERVFRTMRPLVIVEASPRSLEAQGSSREELLETFEGLGYEMYHFDRETGRLAAGVEGQTGDNLVAVPKEMASPAGFEPALSP